MELHFAQSNLPISSLSSVSFTCIILSFCFHVFLEIGLVFLLTEKNAFAKCVNKQNEVVDKDS